VRFGIDVHGMDDVMNSLRQHGRGINSFELAQWAGIVESTARHMCYEVKDNIELNAEGNFLHFSFDDEKSKECLTKAIERHLYVMPAIIQSIFRKLMNDIKSGALLNKFRLK